jgi:hypothetical protein
VLVQVGRRKGRMVIEFGSTEDLVRIVGALAPAASDLVQQAALRPEAVSLPAWTTEPAGGAAPANGGARTVDLTDRVEELSPEQ